MSPRIVGAIAAVAFVFGVAVLTAEVAASDDDAQDGATRHALVTRAATDCVDYARRTTG